jgi:hypothetical protein
MVTVATLWLPRIPSYFWHEHSTLCITVLHLHILSDTTDDALREEAPIHESQIPQYQTVGTLRRLA